jgi:GntR family transcriptional regulator/GntR family frlABCD operon transcriptional regulator
VNNLEQELRAISGEQSVCDLLKLQHGSPVLHIYRKYLTNVKNFYFYSSLYCNTEKFTIGNVFKQKV